MQIGYLHILIVLMSITINIGCVHLKTILGCQEITNGPVITRKTKQKNFFVRVAGKIKFLS